MIRTFIAAEISPAVKKGLTTDIARFKILAPRVKWAEPDNLHLTFRFLGDVKETDLEELFDALEDGVSHLEPFALEVKGVGAFPNWRHPRVVWAGAGEGVDDATFLTASVEEACVSLGYDRERRPFQPHFTLGRVKFPADADGLEDIAADPDKTYGFIDVDAVVVFMSTLRRTGPVYSPMARIELNG
jgi:2''-5'' RNA ligase